MFTKINLDMKKIINSSTDHTKRRFVAAAGTQYSARTLERTFTDNMCSYAGRATSVGRLGISVHVTAGLVKLGLMDIGTLENTQRSSQQ